MKKDIHPAYRDVAFVDLSNDFKFITRSTVQAREKIDDRRQVEYPLVKIEVSSESHPFYTGKHKIDRHGGPHRQVPPEVRCSRRQGRCLTGISR